MSKPTLISLTVVGTLVILAGVALLVLLTGAYDVAATTPHNGLTRWALSTAQHRSVAARADHVEGTLPTDQNSLDEGFEHFDEMCVGCHGAPGIERDEIGQGMRPRPPSLQEDAEDWTDQELFWIIKHGVRLAGMPAFGPTHSDEKIWEITAFVRSLPKTTAKEYARLRQEHGASHSHETDTGEESADHHS
jgi:mono/diheme cytochrome c family protein